MAVANKLYDSQLAVLVKPTDGLYPSADAIPAHVLDPNWEDSCAKRCMATGNTTSVGRYHQRVFDVLSSINGASVYNDDPTSDKKYNGNWCKCNLAITCGLGGQLNTGNNDRDYVVRSIPHVDITWQI